MSRRAAFSERYGPWALVVGASEGIGAAGAAHRGLGLAACVRQGNEAASRLRALVGDSARDQVT